jgi:Domain of unknown function (DUF4864)
MTFRVLVPVMTAALMSLANYSWALSDGEEFEIRELVKTQLAAFEKNDAGLAFAHGSDAIRRRFKSAQEFVGLVRDEYPVVYRPHSAEFYRVDEIAGKMFLPVQLADLLTASQRPIRLTSWPA